MSSVTNSVAGGVIIDGESMAANITSDVVDMRGVKSAGIRIHSASATHVGTLYIEISNRRQNWTAISFAESATGTIASSLSASSGSAFTHYVEVVDCAAQYLRVRYVASSGSGTLHVNVVRKLQAN